MLLARLCAERVLSYGLSSFIWVVQRVCGQVFHPKPDIELLAVQLNSGSAVLHNLKFHNDFLNSYLLPYGFEAQSSCISRLELRFTELSTLSLVVEVDTLHLQIRKKSSDDGQTKASVQDTSTNTASKGMECPSWLKTVFRQIEVRAQRLSIQVDGIGGCEFTGLCFTQKPKVVLASDNLSFSLCLDRNQSPERFLILSKSSLFVDSKEEGDSIAFSGSVESVRSQLTPQVIRRIINTFTKTTESADEEWDEFEDAYSQAGSEYSTFSEYEGSYSVSLEESIFFDCVEELVEDQSFTSVSSSSSQCKIGFAKSLQSWISKKTRVRLDIHEVEIVLSSDFTAQSESNFLVSILDLSVQFQLNSCDGFQVSSRGLKLTDQSYCLHPFTNHAFFNIPKTLSCLLTPLDYDRAYVQLGFPQLQKESYLKLRIKQTQEMSGNKLSVGISCSPIVFCTSCSSVVKLKSLLNKIKFGSSDTVSLETTSFHEVEWKMDGIYGILESPSTPGELSTKSVLFLECKTGDSQQILFSEQTPDRRRSRPFESCQGQTTTLSLFEIHVYHCLLEEHTLMSCCEIFSCTSSDHQMNLDVDSLHASSGKGCVLELTQYLPSRDPSCDLANLAYHLIDKHSNLQTREDLNEQDESLERVEFEGRCMQSMDYLCDLWFDQVKIDLDVYELETMLNVLLEFWRPSKISDQMKITHPPQLNLLMKSQICDISLQQTRTLPWTENLPLNISVDRSSIFLVLGLQKQTISTLDVAIRSLEISTLGRNNVFRIGKQRPEDASLDTSIQFFQISELDYRNAKFKQWTVLQNQQTTLSFDASLFHSLWLVESLKSLFKKNQTKLRTDIEVENCFSFISNSTKLFYKIQGTNNLDFEICLGAVIDQTLWSLQDLKNAQGEVKRIQLSVRQGPTCSRSENEIPTDDGFCQFASEKKLKLKVQPVRESDLDVEIKNEEFLLEVNPNRMATLLQILHSLRKPLCDLQSFTEQKKESASPAEEKISGMQDIIQDVFSSPVLEVQDSIEQKVEEEEDGFVLVDYPLGRRLPEPQSPTGMSLASSQATWLNGNSFDVKQDYLFLPESFNADEASTSDDESCLKLPAGYPHSSLAIRFDGLSGMVVVQGEDPMDHVDSKLEGMSVFYYVFKEGEKYKDRLSGLVQDFEILDWRTTEQILNNKRVIAERNKSKLKTKFSKRLKQMQRVSCPMLQVVLETVMPDVDHSNLTIDKRLKLSLVPLRLRLSQSLIDFFEMYTNAFPNTPQSSSGQQVYFQMCEISPLYIVVDYKPSPFNLERLKTGQTSELLNLVDWGGLEFILNEIKMSGVAGNGSLFYQVLHSWSHDIKSAHRHRLVSGIPALGVLKRLSPATQDVVESSISRVFRKEAPEVNARGTIVSPSQSLSRSARVFGKAILIEALNAGAYASEGLQTVFSDEKETPSDAYSAFKQAGSTLHSAAKSLISEPLESVRSGQGLKTAFSKMTKAAPKAMISPFSALNTIVHGTLRGACDALDTDHILDS